MVWGIDCYNFQLFYILGHDSFFEQDIDEQFGLMYLVCEYFSVICESH